MASSDYRLCDQCGGKAFYDANCHYEWGEPSADDERRVGKVIPGRTLGYLGDWAVLCRKCSKTHTTAIVPRAEHGEPPTDRNAGREAAEVSDPDALIANARLFIETARTEPEKVVAGMVEDLLSVIYEVRTELEKWDLFAGDLRKEVDENRVRLRTVEAALKGSKEKS